MLLHNYFIYYPKTFPVVICIQMRGPEHDGMRVEYNEMRLDDIGMKPDENERGWNMSGRYQNEAG